MFLPTKSARMGSSRCPAGEEDVVDEHDDSSVYREGDLRFAHDRRIADPSQVVAVERDVDRAERNVDALVRPDRVTDPGCERVAARANPDDGEER